MADLVQICKDAHQDSATIVLGCNGCVKFFAAKLEIEVPRGEKSQANDLIEWMKKNWTTVTASEAQAYADKGRFVVAGKKAAGNGHIVVVLPGGPLESGGYVANKGKSKGKKLPGKGKFPRCCSMTNSAEPWIGAISQGEYTTFDPWYNHDGVEYWLAPENSQAAAKKPKSKFA